MDDFDVLAHRASEALRREAAVLADTDRALDEVRAMRPPVAVVDPTNGTRRRSVEIAAAVLGAAAVFVGLVWIVGDDDVERISPAGQVTLPSFAPASTTVTALPTTVPRTSEVPTTVPLTTAAPAPVAGPSSSGVPTTTSPPATTADVSVAGPPVGWSPSQPAPPATLDPQTIPHLVVSTMADSDTRYRNDSASPPRYDGAYVQAFATPDGTGALTVQTDVGTPARFTGANAIDPIGPWQAYETVRSGRPSLILVHGDIQVSIDTESLSDVQLREVAAGLGPQPDGGPGWTVGPLPAGLTPIGADYWWTGGGRSDIVVDDDFMNVSQLNVGVGVAGAGNFPLASNLREGQSIVNFDGSRALYELRPLALSPGAVTRLFWEYQPGVYTELWLAGSWTPTEIMDAARTRISAVDATQWASIPPLPNTDGCPPVWDC